MDQLFNSREKRLARILLLLARFGKNGLAETTELSEVSQATLAEMVGTTRSRASYFMNKFRRLGFIDSNGTLQVHSSLLNLVLHDELRDPSARTPVPPPRSRAYFALPPEACGIRWVVNIDHTGWSTLT